MTPRRARSSTVAAAADAVTAHSCVSRFTIAGGSSRSSVVIGPSRGRRGRYTIRRAAAIHSHSAATTVRATKANVAPFMRPVDRQQPQGIPWHFGQPSA